MRDTISPLFFFFLFFSFFQGDFKTWLYEQRKPKEQFTTHFFLESRGIKVIHHTLSLSRVCRDSKYGRSSVGSGCAAQDEVIGVYICSTATSQKDMGSNSDFVIDSDLQQLLDSNSDFATEQNSRSNRSEVVLRLNNTKRVYDKVQQWWKVTKLETLKAKTKTSNSTQTDATEDSTSPN